MVKTWLGLEIVHGSLSGCKYSEDLSEFWLTDEERAHMESLEQLLHKFAQEGYTFAEEDNDIHADQSIKFGLTYLEYDKWTMEVLTKGLKIDLKRKAVRYEERNNRSAVQNMEVLQQKVDTWEKEGKVHKVDHKPFIVSPMLVVEKFDWSSGKIKYRPVIDHSRYVNRHMEDKP